MCIHFHTAWSKLDHDYSFRLRLVCAPYCLDHFTIIVPSLYHHFEVSSHSPVLLTYLISNPTGENTLHQLFLYMPKYYKFHTLLKLPYYQVKSLYYHGPLIILPSESEWIDLSRVTPPFVFGLLQRVRMHFMS